jgi:hypothetical protein
MMHGFRCVEVFTGVHACAIPCGGAILCPTGTTCTDQLNGGYCRGS